jgi:2Fe-2S ferredoxin
VPTIEFLESPAGRAKTVEASVGGALVDVCDHAYAPVPFSCRSATCGTCHIIVLEGLDLFEPPEAAEQELLDILNGPPGSRLACQAVLKGAPGIVKLRPVDV